MERNSGKISMLVSCVALCVASLSMAMKLDLSPESQSESSSVGWVSETNEFLRDLRTENDTLRERLYLAEQETLRIEASLSRENERISRELREVRDNTAKLDATFGRMTSTAVTTSNAQPQESKEVEDTDDTPKLEDFIRIDLGPINGVPGPNIVFESANIHIRSGSGSTGDSGGPLLGLGNLIIGYNEIDHTRTLNRSGSHNLVVGAGHGFTSFCSIVAGESNEANAPFASVVGGTGNIAAGWASSVTGGQNNVASGDYASANGGLGNRSTADYAAVAGGMNRSMNQEGYFQAGSLAIPP